jgi:multidrug efflux pump subunit AcrA (membrane-fusion protein)
MHNVHGRLVGGRSPLKAYAIVAALLIAIFGAIGGYLYQKFSALASMDFSPPPVTIATSVAQRETWDERLNAVGTVQAVRGVDLTSETSGEIIRINFDSGDAVEAGQLLVVLNDEIEQASRRNQIASLELAEILFERDRALIAQKSIPQSQFDRSRADLERARAQLAETEARLANKRIEQGRPRRLPLSRRRHRGAAGSQRARNRLHGSREIRTQAESWPEGRGGRGRVSGQRIQR